MGWSDYLSKKILDHVDNRATYTAPATIDFALYTTAPTHTTAGIEVTTSGTAYARVNVPNDNTFWGAGTTGTPSTATSLAAVTWATATAPWGTVVAAATFEGTLTNMMAFGNLTASRVVNTGDSVRFAIGGVQHTLQ